MARYAIVFFVGLTIDALQGIFTFVFLGIGTAASAVTLGAGAPVALPAATAVSFASSVTLSATLGAGFMLLLAYCGMFYMNYCLGGGVVELMPGIDVIPAWTFMAISCILRKMGDEGKLKGTSGKLVGAVAAGAGVGAVASMATHAGQKNTAAPVRNNTAPTEERGASESQNMRAGLSDLKNVDGIRTSKTPPPSNDNYILPQTLKHAA